jgi:chemotaxis regulatin CheY-phosphate phosphatase CheZ
VRSCQPAPQSLQELQQALEQEWGRILHDRIRRLIESIPRRVRAVLQAKEKTDASCSLNLYLNVNEIVIKYVTCIIPIDNVMLISVFKMMLII